MDYGTPLDSLVRPGFQALVNMLEERADVAHVLVPDLDHLSPFPTVCMALTAKLGSLGSTVVQREPTVSGPSAS